MLRQQDATIPLENHNSTPQQQAPGNPLSSHLSEKPAEPAPVILGQGAYGTVYKIFDEKGQVLALKKMHRLDIQRAERILREIKLLRFLNHPNIVKLKYANLTEETVNNCGINLAFEFMEGDLGLVIRQESPKNFLENDHIQFVLYQILAGINYLHSAGIIHRDLKPDNILIDRHCKTKICDLGLARGTSIPQSVVHILPSAPELNREITKHVATRWYRSPETLLMDEYGSPADMWSIGCILAELLTMLVEHSKPRSPLFPGKGSALSGNSHEDNPQEQLNVILNIIGKPSIEDIQDVKNDSSRKYLSTLCNAKAFSKQDFATLFPSADPDAIDLLEKLLTFNPKKRITAQEALSHPFLLAIHTLFQNSAQKTTFASTLPSLKKPCGTLNARGNALLSYYEFESKKTSERTSSLIVESIRNELLGNTKRKPTTEIEKENINPTPNNAEISNTAKKQKISTPTNTPTQARFLLFTPSNYQDIRPSTMPYNVDSLDDSLDSSFLQIPTPPAKPGI